MDFDAWDFGEPENRVVLPADHPRLPRFLQRPARSLDAAALDLVEHAVRVDRQADVDRGDEARAAQLVRDFDFGEHRAVGAEVLVFRERDAVTASLRALPGGP